MKFKKTVKGKLKVTMTLSEADVIASILGHVRLGSGYNSDIVLDFLMQMEPHTEQEIPVEFEYSTSEGYVINV